MATGAMFDPVIEPLMKDFRLVVVDNRGFGQSADLEGPYTIAQMAEDTLAVINEVSPNEPVHLLGYSKGGLISQMVARNAPHRIKSLNLSVTFAFKIATALERMQRQFLPTVIKRVGAKGISRMMMDGIAGGLSISPRDFYSFKRQLASCRDDALLAVGLDLFKFDSRPWLAELTMPTLVISASDDIVVPIHHQRELVAGIPNARLKVVPQAGHALVYTHTELFVSYIREFVEQQEAALQAAV
jgi:pimeloyl-ACP methyl ester carboxylesterase